MKLDGQNILCTVRTLTGMEGIGISCQAHAIKIMVKLIQFILDRGSKFKKGQSL